MLKKSQRGGGGGVGAPTPLGARPKPRGGSPDPLLNGFWGGLPTPSVHDSIKPAGLVRRELPNLSESSLVTKDRSPPSQAGFRQIW